MSVKLARSMPVSLLTGSQAIPASEIKNGNVGFALATSSAQTPIPGAPGCPNPNWRQDITDIAFTSAVITVQQPVSNLVLTVVCAFSSPTANGAVPAENVSCTQQ